MSDSFERIRRARRALGLAATARGVIVALAVALGVLLSVFAVEAIVALPLPLRRAVLPFAIVMGATMFFWEVGRRIAPTWRASDEAMALWFERRIPSLRYALVTSIDADVVAPSPAGARALADSALEAEVSRAACALLVRPLATLLIALVALFLVLWGAPTGALTRLTEPRPGDTFARIGTGARAAGDPLATIVVRVVSPAYTGRTVEVIDDPSVVSALAGSRIVIEGRGVGVTAQLESIALVPTEQDGRWRIVLTVPARVAGLRLHGPARDRVLVVESIADSMPVVRLDEPTRDSVLRTARGTLVLRADVRDDYGLANGGFEYIVSAGAGEAFTFRSGRIAARSYGPGVREARIEGTLLLDTLNLGPGDLIHLRAIARDRNDVTGPREGVSETRTIRIARADEYDSVSVDPMPPSEPEKNALSQRMILLMTIDVRDRAPRLGLPALQRESRRLAVEQSRLRKRVGEVIFTRLGENPGEHAHFDGDGHAQGAEKPLDPDQVLAAAERAVHVDATRTLESEGDESPVVAINRPLLEAYNHMWRASTELETARPTAAIPWMERAIEALQRARAAERIYLRGRPPRVVVDVAKVRGTGREQGTPSMREARVSLDADRVGRLRRFDVALAIVTAAPAAAADSLLLLRLSLPVRDRAAAEALVIAADAVRRGGDVTAVLRRARRALADAPTRQALLPWGG